MDLYLVKELVQVTNLDVSPGRPSIKYDLEFPYLLEPLDQSKSARYFVGKVRDVVDRNFEQAAATFYLETDFSDFTYGHNWMTMNIAFDIHRDMDCGGDGFHTIFGKENFDFSMTLSFCHLPSKDTPVSPDALWTLNECLYFDEDEETKDDIWCCYMDEPSDNVEIKKMQKLWNHKTGFIYSKLTVVVSLNEDAVKMVMEQELKDAKGKELADMNRKMLTEEICTDLEIRCMDDKIVKCHRAVLGGRSKVLQAMFQAEEMEEARTGRLEMEEMSEKCVREFLGWIYWNDEKEALLDPDVAVKLLILGDKYDLEGLVDNMKEIVLKRRGYDEEWFTVESVINLLGWAKNLEGMKELWEKAVGVLKFFRKTCPEKLLESEEYQEFIRNDAEAAMDCDSNNYS